VCARSQLLEEAPLCAVDSADGGTCPSECMATWGVDGEIGTDQTLGHICEFMRWEIPEQFEGGMHNSWVPLASRDNQEMGYSCRDFLCVQPAARLHADDALPYYDCRQCCFCSDPIPPHIEVESPIVDVPAPPSPPAPTSGTGTSEGFCLPTLHQGDNMCDASTAPYDPDAPDWACPFTGVTKVGCHDSLEMFTSYGIYAMIFPEQMPLPCERTVDEERVLLKPAHSLLHKHGNSSARATSTPPLVPSLTPRPPLLILCVQAKLIAHLIGRVPVVIWILRFLPIPTRPIPTRA
jgi:hypothetical protein